MCSFFGVIICVVFCINLFLNLYCWCWPLSPTEINQLFWDLHCNQVMLPCEQPQQIFKLNPHHWRNCFNLWMHHIKPPSSHHCSTLVPIIAEGEPIKELRHNVLIKPLHKTPSNERGWIVNVVFIVDLVCQCCKELLPGLFDGWWKSVWLKGPCYSH